MRNPGGGAEEEEEEEADPELHLWDLGRLSVVRAYAVYSPWIAHVHAIYDSLQYALCGRVRISSVMRAYNLCVNISHAWFPNCSLYANAS